MNGAGLFGSALGTILLAGFAIFGIALVVVIASYNKLVGLRQLVRNSWADVDVSLKRRADLIPQLVETVKAYAQHEQNLFANVSAARSQALSANAPTARAEAEQALGANVSKLIALREAYPQLKANESFMELQKELSNTEKVIANARQYYNACVRDHNTAREAFPSVIVAGMMGLKPAEYFELDALPEREAPNIGSLDRDRLANLPPHTEEQSGDQNVSGQS